MMRELLRLAAADGSDGNCGLEGVQTLVIWNALAAPIYANFGLTASGKPTAPTASSWDVAIPGEAYMTIPVRADAESVRFVVDYPGAVPGADVQCVVYGSECAWAPFVGPLA